MSDPGRSIEEFFRRRYDREALYVPSGRFALYIALREWLRPGDRILISPVNDDVVFFTVLAAGLVPVLGPLDPATGSLDPTAVPETTWSSLKAVMTTNLYGIPDRMDILDEKCRRHGVLLIEDACQALDSRFRDRRIGQMSTVSAFSLTKHVAGVGGVLCFSDGGRRSSLVRKIEGEIRRRSTGGSARHTARFVLRRAADRTGTRAALNGVRQALLPKGPERDGHRMPYDLPSVLRARDEGAGLDRFDTWVRVDNPEYRTAPIGREIRMTLRQLEQFEDNRRRRIEGTRRLVSLGFTPPGLRLPEDTALFRVPLFVLERERVLAEFKTRHLTLDYIYDPPLDLYAAPSLAERLISPDSARVWSRDVLPVDPLHSDRFLSALKKISAIRAASGQRM